VVLLFVSFLISKWPSEGQRLHWNSIWNNIFMFFFLQSQWVRSLDLTTHTSLSPIRRGFVPGFVNYKKGPLDSQPQVIKFTSCLARVGGSLRVLRLPPPLNTRAPNLVYVLRSTWLRSLTSGVTICIIFNFKMTKRRSTFTLKLRLISRK
jgi:hypothetical protein